MKNTFKIYINEVDYSEYITYPVEFVDKNLGESFNTLNLTLFSFPSDIPFTSHSKSSFEWLVDGVVKKWIPLLLISDTVEKLGSTDKYKHTLNFIESTYYLDLIALPDMSITRYDPIDGVEAYLPTLADVAERILKLAYTELSDGSEIPTFNSSTLEILNNILSPEWTFTGMTALEALRSVFNYAKITPSMEYFDSIDYIKPSYFAENESKVSQFSGTSEVFNPNSYRTRIVSDVSNMVISNKNISVVTELANSWMTPKSPDGYEISNDNAIIETSKPIYSIEELKNRVKLYYWTVNGGGGTSVEVPEDIIPDHYFKDLTSYIYEKEVYDALPNTEVVGGKGCSLYYEQGKKDIKGLTYRSPSKWSWIPNQQSWKNILDDVYDTDNPISLEERLERYIKPEFLVSARALLANEGYVESVEDNVKKGFDVNYGGIFGVGFRVKYIPYIDTKIYSYRERKRPNELLTTQFYNQQADIVDSQTMAILHDSLSQSNAGKERSITMLHKEYNEMLKIGYRFKDYIITQCSLTISQTTIAAKYELDEYFVKLNAYLSVMEKRRQFSIPSQNIVDRQYTIFNFAKFALKPSISFMDFETDKYTGSSEEKINLMKFKLNDTNITSIHPVVSYPFNNVLVFEGELPHNASLGNKSVEIDSNKRREEPVKFTNKAGRINETVDIHFINQFAAKGSDSEIYNYPLAPTMSDSLSTFIETIDMDKDAREKLKISLQIHHIDTTGSIYINPLFIEHNGLVGGEGFSNLKIALLRNKPFNSNKVSNADIAKSVTATITYHSNGFYILPTITNGLFEGIEAVAVIDADKNVLYWSDEVVGDNETSIQYYLNFDYKY